MPQYHCRNNICQTLVSSPGYCDGCRPFEAARKNSYYDRHRRDPEAKRFYDSAAWQRCRAGVIASRGATCERCKTALAEHVHHVIPLDRCTPDQKLDPSNLLALCQPCHNAVTSEEDKEVKLARRFIAGTIDVCEDETYHYDIEKADKPIRFIERYCKHFEGVFAGEPFRLLDWQKRIVRTLFGWVRRDNDRRRFRELYLISAKGAGKTPMLAAIALFMLLGDGESAPHVVSMASTFEQANLTFSAGKGYIAESPDLGRHTTVKQYAITDAKHGKWTTISGKPTGRSGPRPSCIIADELHEWPGPTAQAFELLCANLFKRAQPLLLCATNAGADRSSFAWTLHERATKVISGELVDLSLLPFIFETPPEVAWDSEAAAAVANPSLGAVVQWDQLAPAVARARENPAAEAKYRRLYLSQWGNGSALKWLDPARWAACTAPLPTDLGAVPLFVGLDLSQGDDLCAAALVYAGSSKFYLNCRAWLPGQTAAAYQKSEGHDYLEWAKAGAIELLPETTITPDVQQRIADYLIDLHKRHPITAVAYDRYKADAVISSLEKAGITCIAMAQGYTVSPGCVELSRRLTEGSIQITPNAVLSSHAEQVEIKCDERGNIWPVKPNARDRYKGRRGIKIDLIAATVTALTEVMRRNIKPAQAEWKGGIWIV